MGRFFGYGRSPSTSVPLYDNFGVLDDYSPELTFFFKIDASDFDAIEGAPCDYALGAVVSVVLR